MIGVAIGWKYNHAPGIETKGGKITAWPDGIGPQPTEAEIAIIVDEYAVIDAAQSEIARLEGEVTQRRMREAALGTDGGWLSHQEALISAERGKING